MNRKKRSFYLYKYCFPIPLLKTKKQQHSFHSAIKFKRSLFDTLSIKFSELEQICAQRFSNRKQHSKLRAQSIGLFQRTSQFEMKQTEKS